MFGIKDWPKDVPARGRSGRGSKKMEMVAWALVAAPVLAVLGVVAELAHGYGLL